jgi:hypothetical protein
LKRSTKENTKGHSQGGDAETQRDRAVGSYGSAGVAEINADRKKTRIVAGATLLVVFVCAAALFFGMRSGEAAAWDAFGKEDVTAVAHIEAAGPAPSAAEDPLATGRTADALVDANEAEIEKLTVDLADLRDMQVLLEAQGDAELAEKYRKLAADAERKIADLQTRNAQYEQTYGSAETAGNTDGAADAENTGGAESAENTGNAESAGDAGEVPVADNAARQEGAPPPA